MAQTTPRMWNYQTCLKRRKKALCVWWIPWGLEVWIAHTYINNVFVILGVGWPTWGWVTWVDSTTSRTRRWTPTTWGLCERTHITSCWWEGTHQAGPGPAPGTGWDGTTRRRVWPCPTSTWSGRTTRPRQCRCPWASSGYGAVHSLTLYLHRERWQPVYKWFKAHDFWETWTENTLDWMLKLHLHSIW